MPSTVLPTLTLTFEDRVNMHLQEVERKLNSQAWQRSPLLDVLLQNTETYDGGEYITIPVEDNYTPTGGAISEGSTLSVSQPNLSVNAMYQPRLVWEGLYIDGWRKTKIMTGGSMGPILNWVEEQAENRGRAIRENLATYISAAATATGPDGATAPQSIFDIVKATGTVGNISATNSTYWASQVNSTSGAWSATGPARFRSVLRQSRRYKGFAGPDVLFASATTIDAMKATNYSKTTFFRAPDTRDEKVGEAGDGKWTWTATAPYDPDAMIDNIPVYYDPHLDGLESSALSTGGILLGINSKAICFKQAPGLKFSMDPWRAAEARFGSFSRIFWAGELVARCRSANILLTNIL